MRRARLTSILLVFVLAAFTPMNYNSARAAYAAEINRDAENTLQKLYIESSSAKALAEKAEAILVFPGIAKGGFLVGGQYGERAPSWRTGRP